MSTRLTISLRISNSLKEAIQKAAEEDCRSVASLTEKLLIDYLQKNNSLI